MSATLGRKRMDVLIASQNRRQAILDHLNATPLRTAAQLAVAIGGGVDARTVQHSLTSMRMRGEVAATGPHLCRQYVAVVKTTVSAQVLYDAISVQRELETAAKRAAAEATAAKKKVAEPWRTVHIGGKLKSTNQGGQGALRPRVDVNTQHLY